MRFTTMTLLALCGACGKDDRPIASAAPPAPADARSVVASAGSAAAPVAETEREHMQEHFEAVREAERAVIRGDLATARDRGRWIAEHAEHPALAEWQPYVEAVRAAGRELAAASDLAMAAPRVAVLAQRCAACHEERAAIVTFDWEPEPPVATTLASVMARHRWAAERLWEGVVGPADARWSEGATSLAAVSFDTVLLGERGDASRLRDIATKVKLLAGEAIRTEDHAKRVELYGQLLQTCASCHALTRDAP